MAGVVRNAWAWTGRGLAAAADLVLPSRCAACHGVAGPLCITCADAVRLSSRAVEVRGGGGIPPASGMPSCWAGARFEGAVRLAVTAYKDEGRRDLRATLARPLSAALAGVAAGDPVVRRRLALGEEVIVVPVPTSRDSRRRRGDDPIQDLAVTAVAAVNGAQAARARRSAAAGGDTGGFVVAPALGHTRRVADQAHLDRRARATNLHEAMAVATPWRAVLRGASCVLVDDVVTSGATLTEAARALRAAGARHVVAATCATTPAHSPTPALWPTGPPTSVSA